MELPKIKHNKLEKLGHLKFNHNFPTRDGLLLKSLQNENSFIKKKLAEFESRLDLFPIGKPIEKFNIYTKCMHFILFKQNHMINIKVNQQM